MPKRLTIDQFIERAKLIHADKYDYSKVNYIHSARKVLIICKEHGEFIQRASIHLKGHGCPKCSLRTSNTIEFIERAKLIHADKYDYSKVNYTNAHNKVVIICKEHGEFKQKPNNHLSGKGCHKCGRLRYNTIEFIERAKLVHADKYDYSKVNYTHSARKVLIICKEHGEFIQRASIHLEGHGCPKCSLRTSNTIEFIEKAKLVHADKYDYSKVNYSNCKSKIVIICKEHGEFIQRATYHLSGNGCHKCGLIRSMTIIQSKPEIEFLDYLSVPKENRAYPIGKYVVDGIVNNTIYEFLGDYWHGHNRLEKGLNHIDIQIKRLLTQCRFEQLKRLTDFNIKYVWEADWNEYRKLGGHLKLRTFKDKVETD